MEGNSTGTRDHIPNRHRPVDRILERKNVSRSWPTAQSFLLGFVLKNSKEVPRPASEPGFRSVAAAQAGIKGKIPAAMRERAHKPKPEPKDADKNSLAPRPLCAKSRRISPFQIEKGSVVIRRSLWLMISSYSDRSTIRRHQPQPAA